MQVYCNAGTEAPGGTEDQVDWDDLDTRRRKDEGVVTEI